MPDQSSGERGARDVKSETDEERKDTKGWRWREEALRTPHPF